MRINIITTTIDLVEYIKQCERQKECLKLSLIFDDAEKQRVAKTIDELIEIAQNRLNELKDVNNIDVIL